MPKQENLKLQRTLSLIEQKGNYSEIYRDGTFTETFQEEIAKKVLDHGAYLNFLLEETLWDHFRKKTYLTKSHEKEITLDPRSPRTEEHIAKRIVLNARNHSCDGFSEKLGEAFDYQTPLKASGDTKAGKLDIVSIRQNDVGDLLNLIELKKPDSGEPLLRAVLEIATYWRLLNRNKFLDDKQKLGAQGFKADSGKTTFQKVVMVFKGSVAAKNAVDAKLTEVRKLRKKLGVNVAIFHAIDVEAFIDGKVGLELSDYLE